MRVTIISKAFVVGAYQRKLEALAALPNIELTAVVPASWREAGYIQELEIAHTQGYQLITAPLACNGSFHLHFYPTLASILRRIRPDVCHVDEEPYNLATYLAVNATRHIGARPLFFTWQNLLHSYPFPFSAMEQANYRNCRAAIAGNTEAADVLRAKGYQGNIALIPQFGIDPHLFEPAREPHKGVFTIGYAGRLVEQKGLMVLLQALVLLDGEWRLEISGSGPLMPKLVSFLQKYTLSDRVVFHQHIPSEEMPDYYRNLDVLVLPSLSTPSWKEQFGRVLIEAMACGVPVIGSNSGEIPNVIGDGGLVTPEGEIEALSEHIERVRDDSALRQDLGQRGRARVLAHYTHECIAVATMRVYEWLASDSSPTPGWGWASEGMKQ
ncbi:MAG: glycosyltransferase family 4 protein [Chloroflexi bacterium]|nr:glycosyltransferase family 4 protein [Chloroflexota bacterium]